ncbi:MAG: EI24 domain-containing protein [Sulfurovum sp.]|nr:MAG: Uncharacterised protein [Arcobacter lacus]
MNEFNVLARSIRDFLTFNMLKFTLIPFIVTFVLIYSMFFAAADYSISSLQDVATASANHQEVIIDENAPTYYKWGAEAIVLLFQYSITSWLAGFFLYVFGTFLVWKLSIILTIAVVGFLTPYIINTLNKKNYPNIVLKGHGTLLDTMWILLKTTVVMIVLFIVLIPVYFIPLLNIFAFFIPFYYFFHKLMNSDVAMTMLSKDEYFLIYGRKKNVFRIKTLFLYLLSLIPFLAMFVSVFFIIYLANSYFLELDRENNLKIEEINLN